MLAVLCAGVQQGWVCEQQQGTAQCAPPGAHAARRGCVQGRQPRTQHGELAVSIGVGICGCTHGACRLVAGHASCIHGVTKCASRSCSEHVRKLVFSITVLSTSWQHCATLAPHFCLTPHLWFWHLHPPAPGPSSAWAAAAAAGHPGPPHHRATHAALPGRQPPPLQPTWLLPATAPGQLAQRGGWQQRRHRQPPEAPAGAHGWRRPAAPGHCQF